MSSPEDNSSIETSEADVVIPFTLRATAIADRRPVIILDLDNCIADDSERVGLINWNVGNPDERYEAYHSLCGDDRAHLAGLDVDIFRAINGAHMVGQLVQRANLDAHRRYVEHPESVRTFILTARPVTVAEQTKKWLHSHDIRFEAVLHRNVGDHRKSVDVKRSQLGWMFEHYGVKAEDVVAALDDREDIVEMYRAHGIPAAVRKIHDLDAYRRETPTARKPSDVADSIATKMEAAVKTFRERNVLYGDNFVHFGKAMQAVFPNGARFETVDEWNRLGVLVQIVAKCTRYGASFSEGGHVDSAHDAGVYSFILEGLSQP